MADSLYCYPFQILCQPLSWWSSAAAWVQAIGTILAILAAIGIPMYINWLQETRRDGERKLRQDSYALSFLDATEELNGSIERTRRRLSQSDDQEELESIAKLLAVPESLKKRLKHMHELGELGVHLQAAVVAASRAKQLLDFQVFYHDCGGEAYVVGEEHLGPVDVPAPEDASPHLERAQILASLALAGIRAKTPSANPESALPS